MSTRKLATTMPAKARRPRATSGRSRAADGKLFRETKKEDADARNSNRKYDVGRGKAPKATRFQKGKSGNPKGRPKKKDEDFDPGKILEAIDNEECVFIYNGKRKVLRNGEVSFRLLFSEAIDGNFEAAKLVKVMAEEYFGPQAEGPSQARFVVVP